MEKFLEKYNDHKNLVFLYGLVYQKSNERLYNYIATEFNKIEKPIRNLAIIDWSNLLRYLNEKYSSLDMLEVNEFWASIFTGSFTSISYNIDNSTIQKALVILNGISSNDDLMLIGDGTFSDPQFYIEETIHRRASDFEHLSMEEKKDIMRIYHEYKKEFQNEYLAENDSEDGVSIFSLEELIPENSIWVVANTELKHLFLKEHSESLTRFYEVFHKESMNKRFDEEIKNEFSQFINTEVNMRLSAYFLHYVLLSLSAPSIPVMSKRSNLEFNRIDNKRIFERLLCSLTTKDSEKLNQVSSSYYSTISNLFEFEGGYAIAKENVLRDLDQVKATLSKYKLERALELLNEDYAKILAIE